MRRFVSLWVGLVGALVGFSLFAGVTGSWMAAALGGLALAAVSASAAWRFLPSDAAAAPRWLKAVSAVAAALALIQLFRITVFTVDETRVGYSNLPGSEWEVQHSCLTAYWVAARAVGSDTSIYANVLYTSPDDDPRLPRKPLMLGKFRIDVFEYPPPFLLLPRALLPLAPGFARYRMLWFAIHVAVTLLAMAMVARWMGPASGTRAVLFGPFVWLALGTLSTLQKGNVQWMVIAGAMIAMLLLERKRWALGGALLAFVTVSKLYPGLLIVLLLAQRRWRAVAWTASMMAVLTLVTWAVFGAGPFASFLEHLPGLLGGEAFPAFRNPAARANNLSVPGLAFKLGLLGVPGMSFPASKLIGWIYSAVALVVTLRVARRTFSDEMKPAVWLAIITLATLRSPFLPLVYGTVPALWLLTILAAASFPTPRMFAAFALGWAALAWIWPADWTRDPRALAIATFLLPQAAIAATIWLALRPERAREIAKVPSGRVGQPALTATRS